MASTEELGFAVVGTGLGMPTSIPPQTQASVALALPVTYLLYIVVDVAEAVETAVLLIKAMVTACANLFFLLIFSYNYL